MYIQAYLPGGHHMLCDARTMVLKLIVDSMHATLCNLSMLKMPSTRQAGPQRFGSMRVWSKRDGYASWPAWTKKEIGS